MKSTFRLLTHLLLGILFLTGCRASQSAFKGMELYSWQDQAGGWRFSILPGTNRNKSVSEVQEQPLSRAEVQVAFCQMAKKEQVFWMPYAVEADTGQHRSFAYTPEEIQTQIRTFADRCKVQLVVFERSP